MNLKLKKILRNYIDTMNAIAFYLSGQDCKNRKAILALCAANKGEGKQSLT